MATSIIRCAVLKAGSVPVNLHEAAEPAVQRCLLVLFSFLARIAALLMVGVVVSPAGSFYNDEQVDIQQLAVCGYKDDRQKW